MKNYGFSFADIDKFVESILNFLEKIGISNFTRIIILIREGKLAFIDVSLTEVSSVQYEAYLSVSVAPGPVQHELKLRYVVNTPGVFLIEKRFTVVCIVCNGIIKNRQIYISFWFSVVL